MIESQMSRINVLVAHEVPIVAAGLAATLREHPEFNVSVQDERVAWSGAVPLRRPVDVVVTGHAGALRWMKDVEALAAAVSGERPRILLVALSDREADVRAALDAGVHGYLVMACELPELVGCVGMLGRGLRYLCPSAARRVAESLTHQCLTAREGDVLHLMIEGCSNKVIARELDIAVGTVKSHVKAVFSKLAVSTRLQAVAAAAERGLGVSAGVQVIRPRPKLVTLPFPSPAPGLVAGRGRGGSPDPAAHLLQDWSALAGDRRIQGLTAAAHC